MNQYMTVKTGTGCEKTYRAALLPPRPVPRPARAPPRAPGGALRPRLLTLVLAPPRPPLSVAAGDRIENKQEVR